MSYVKDKDGIEMCMPDGDKTAKTDPSVRVTDLYLKGEPRGCVPIERTMRKPEAYSPAKSGQK
jgi:hypothetical protein